MGRTAAQDTHTHTQTHNERASAQGTSRGTALHRDPNLAAPPLLLGVDVAYGTDEQEEEGEGEEQEKRDEGIEGGGRGGQRQMVSLIWLPVAAGMLATRSCVCVFVLSSPPFPPAPPPLFRLVLSRSCLRLRLRPCTRVCVCVCARARVRA